MSEVKRVNANLLIAHHSFSSINEHDSCQGLYWSRKVEGLKDPPTDKMSFGRDFGTAVLKGLQVRPEPGSPSADDFTRPVAPEAEVAAQFYLREARARGYYRPTTQLVAERPLRIEPEQWALLCDYYKVEEPALDRPIIGYPDLEHDDLLVELKTTERVGFQPSYTFQTILYTMALHGLGKRISAVEVHQLKRTIKTLELSIYPVELRYEFIAAVLRWFNSRIARVSRLINDDTSWVDLDLSVGWWCNRCPKSLTCPLYRSTIVAAR